MTVPVKRFIVIVLDSVGVGALPDAAQYGDEGANTLGNIMKARGPDLALPHLAQLGLFQLPALSGAPSTPASGAYGTMPCQSQA
jgi:phosphopentomutase